MKAKKHLGQNFLINEGTLHKIVETADIQADNTIVEVGPGKGVLTAELVKKAKQVISIEKDAELIPLLAKKFANQQNLQLIEADVLQTQIPTDKYKVVANIPYYITSPILKHFLQSTNPPQSMTLLVQLEVAQKICAQAGDHSVLSLQVQLYGTPRLIAKVPPSHFAPSPKVDSAILHIQTFEPPYSNAQNILKFAKMAFAQRRKKLRNTLIKSLKLDPETIEKNSGIDLNRRPETLSLEEWDQLVGSIS